MRNQIKIIRLPERDDGGQVLWPTILIFVVCMFMLGLMTATVGNEIVATTRSVNTSLTRTAATAGYSYLLSNVELDPNFFSDGGASALSNHWVTITPTGAIASCPTSGPVVECFYLSYSDTPAIVGSDGTVTHQEWATVQVNAIHGYPPGGSAPVAPGTSNIDVCGGQQSPLQCAAVAYRGTLIRQAPSCFGGGAPWQKMAFFGVPYDTPNLVNTPAPPTTTTVSQLLPAFACAIDSAGLVSLATTVNIDPSAVGAAASLYGGTFPPCTNNTTIAGDVLTTATDVNINSSCIIDGNLYANGNISITNSATITGNVYAFGGTVTLSSTPSIGGSVYAIGTGGTGGQIDLSNDHVKVGGGLFATWTVSGIDNATIGGPVDAVDTSIGDLVMPSSPPFPALDPTVAQLQASGYQVIQVGDTGAGQPSCSAYFGQTYWPVASPGAFVAAVNSATVPTAIYAPSCTNAVAFNNYNGSPITFSLPANEVWVVGGFTTNTGANFTSAGNGTHDLSIVVPDAGSCPSGGNIDLNNANTFSTSLNVLLYTPCSITTDVRTQLTGQILAGGGITASASGSSAFTITFSNAAARELPGTSGS